MHFIRKALMRFAVAAALFIPLLFCGQARAGQEKFILVLHSYHYGFGWTDSIQRGLESAVAQSPAPRPELFIEYMDTKRFPPGPLFPRLAAEYRAKYEGNPPGVIITTDDNAMNFMLDHGRKIFPMVPVVFCGVNNFQEARIADRPEMTGVLEDYDLEGTIDLALELFPKARTAAVIADATETGALNLARFKSIAHRYAGKIDFLELAGLSANDLADALRKLPQGAIIVDLGLFRDKEGRVFTIPQGTAFIREHANAPIFSFWDFYLGTGIVGGRLVSGDMQGRAAAEMALKILSGVPPSSIPILRESPNRYMFDDEALTRAGLTLEDLPEGSEVINIPDAFTRRYKKEIIAAAVVFCALLLLIAIMTANILQRRKAQDELGRMLAEWRAIFENSQVGILVLRGGRKIHQANQRLADILGYDGPEELQTLDVRDLHLSKEAFENFGREHYESLRAGRKTHVEYRFRRKNGTPFWGLISGKAVNPDDLSQGVIWVVDDITERKLAELALLESERKYKSIIENIQDVYYRTDKDGLIELISPSALDVLGYARVEEIVGKPAASFYQDPAARDAFLKDLTRQRQVHDYEVTLVRKDGTPIPVSTSSNFYYDHGGNFLGVEGVFRDITDRKRAENALEDMNRTLEEQVRERTRDLEARSAELEAAYSRLMDVDRLKSALLSTVSHDLRTPLTSILGFARIIQRDLSRHIFPALGGCEENLAGKMERIDDNLSIIVSEGGRLTRLINDLLDLSKIEAGHMEWKDREVSVEAVVNEAVKAVSGEFMAKPDVVLESAVATNLPHLLVDPDRMAQVLINLLNNAAKFTDKGTVRVRAMAARNSRVEIVVEDTGVGMPRMELVKVFDRFHKVERGDAAGSSSRGSGLGLAICKEIVLHYSGRIWAESNPGAGSAFHVELPAAPVKKAGTA